MQEDNGHPVAPQAHGGHDELSKFRAWVLGPFETLQRQPKYGEMAAEWQLEQEELFVKQAVGDDLL